MWYLCVHCNFKFRSVVACVSYPIPADIPLMAEHLEAMELAHQQEGVQEAGETTQVQENLPTEQNMWFEVEPITIEEQPC